MPFEVAGLVAPLQADDDLQVLLVGQLVGLHQGAEAGGVDATRLLHEDVLAGRNGGGVVDGSKARRRGQDDDVHARGDGLLIGVEARRSGVRAGHRPGRGNP